MKTNTLKTWQALADALGITPATLRAWRANRDAPNGKDLAEWKQWRDERLPTQGRDTTEDAATLADLKRALLSERGRKESALASLHELQLERQRESLIPESFAVDRMIRTLVPLRRLLDSMPRHCSSTANPQDPMIAELAMRNFLDDRVFSEMVKIIDRFEAEDAERKGTT